MEKWIKPEITVENFELSQHVAYGCGTKTEITVTPGGSVTVGIGCASSYPGKGHWHAKFDIVDTNKNGKIDWSEVTAQMEVADNGNFTGVGHSGHHVTITTPGGQEIETTEIPFSS